MKTWLITSLIRGASYGLYLLAFILITLIYVSLQSIFPASAWTWTAGYFFFGASFCAFIALWRFFLAFSVEPRLPDGGSGYIELPAAPEEKALSELLLSHSKQLRRIALSYEKHRQIITIVGSTIALASLSVPIVTWTVILKEAFSTKEALPNAWLLVVSSTTAGTLGLAIAVTFLRHLKNNQRPHADISDRLLTCIEVGLCLNASDLLPEQKSFAYDKALKSLIKTPGTTDASDQTPAEPEEKDVNLVLRVLAPLLKHGP